MMESSGDSRVRSRDSTAPSIASRLLTTPRPGASAWVTLILVLLCGELGIAGAQSLLWEATGPANSYFGGALSKVGDVNGDGVQDVAVGAPYAGTNSQGAAYVLSGVNGAVVWSIQGTLGGGTLAQDLAGVGDTNGDGAGDVAVRGPGDVRLYSGANGALLYQWPGIAYAFLADAGDTNGDGIADILAGDGWSFGYSGQARLFSGANGSNLVTLVGPWACAWFGGDVAGLGDVNGDSLGEFIVSQPENAGVCTSGFPPGKVFIYSGPGGTLVDQVQPPSGMPTLDFGMKVCAMGDVNGDAAGDFCVSNWGAVGLELFIYSGSDRTLITVLPPPMFGPYIFDHHDPKDAGDVDGDGVPDLLVGDGGAGLTIPNVGGAGKAIVYSGADWSLLRELNPPGSELWAFGTAVAGPGDVNSDDFPDLAIGVPGSMFPLPPGRVRLFSGAPTGVGAFGAGCAGPSGAAPRIGATRSPQVGTTFQLNLSRTAPGRSVLGLLGFSDTDWSGVPLPLNLGFLGIPACDLLVAPHLVVGLTTTAFGPGNGRAILAIPIPGTPSLVGLPFFAQWYVVDPGPAPLPGAMTRALAMTIQA